MVTITMNGLVASGREGMSILDLAKEMGIQIPTLCHDPHLAPYGACRLCLVEDEKSGALLASCVTPISPGMVIHTASPRVLEARKIVVQLMLAAHPESCLVCDKGNRCQLRQIAAELGIGLLDLYKLPNYSGTQEVNPFIRRDLSKCILCAKCIRADHELVVVGAIDYFHRGFETKPATLHDQPLEKSECTFCGACVDLCPTGALIERESSFHGAATKTFSSVCPYCACGCTLLVGTAEERVVRIRSDGEKPSGNSPALCVKGHYGWEFINSSERLKTPLIRRGGKLSECSWEEALHHVASELTRIQSQGGPDQLAFFGSARCTNEENYLFQKLARGGVGTNNIDHTNPLNGLPSPGVFGPGLGWGATSAPLASIEESKGILVIGANPEETAPIVAYKIKRAVRFKGAKLFLVDPRRTKLVPFAQAWLRPELKKDWALIFGFIRALVEEGRAKSDWVQNHADGLETLLGDIQTFDLAWAEEETGIRAEVIRRCAKEFSACQPMAIIFGSGLWQGSQGASSLRGLANLALLLGSQSRFYPLGKESNGQGARDMGSLPGFLPGYQSIEDRGVHRKFEDAWGKPFPLGGGWNALQMIGEARRGRVRGMYIMGENPVRSFPDSSFVQEGLGKLEFLVVQDLFLTETAQLAHVVLPACSFAEKDGTMTNMERRIQLLRAATEPLAQSLPDWKILLEVSQRMGLAKNTFSPKEIMEEIRALVPLYGGITYERLEKGDLYWPCLDGGDPGRPYLHEKGSPSVKPKFAGLQKPETSREKEDRKTSFQLILGSTLYHFGSGTRSSRSPRLIRFCSQGTVMINTGDAAKLGLEEGSQVKISSGRKEVACLLSLDDGLPPGVLFLPIAPSQASVLDLFSYPLDRAGEFPLSKSVAVQIERI